MPSGVVVGDLLKSSLRLSGAFSTGEVPNADEMNDSLNVLNDLLEDMSTENLAVWQSSNSAFALVPGQAIYTIGPTGADFVAPRPVNIAAAYMNFGGVDFPMQLINQDEYNLISLKSMQQPIVERLLYVNDTPNGIITVWPVPATSTQMTLSIDRVLTQAANINTTLNGPPGFVKAVRFLLAVELAPEFGREPTQSLVLIAAEAKGNYKRANSTPVYSRFDEALTDSGFTTWQRGY